MTPYAITMQNITEDDLRDLAICGMFVKNLPDPDPIECIQMIHVPDDRGKIPVWSCHGLVRAFAIVSERPWGYWKIADGWFARTGQQHSWLWHQDEDHTVILDVYPVASHRPILVDAGSMSPWSHLYMDMPRTYSEKHRKKWEDEMVHALDCWKRVGK